MANALGPISYLSADDLRSFGYAGAVAAIESALIAGVDPGADPARTAVPADRGQLLVMPSVNARGAGVKVISLAPGNADRGLPLIQGLYVLFDPVTLSPVALLDGAELTTLRTPAVSMAAVKPALRRSGEPVSVVVFGAGPQGTGHASALAEVIHGQRRLESVTYVVRRARDLPDVDGISPRVVQSGTGDVDDALSEANVVICATTAREPLFDSAVLRDDAVVIAVGSHDPDRREVDSALCRRAQVIVEDVTVALRECGDVVQAVHDGALEPSALLSLRDIVTGAAAPAVGRPVLFKGSGMSWQDLAVAEAVVATAGAGPA